MKTLMKLGDVVIIPDGREGLLLERSAEKYMVRVRRVNSQYFQFLPFDISKIKAIRTARRFNEIK